MKMTELDRAIAIGLTKDGELMNALNLVKRCYDQHTPQEKADLLCYQWVVPFDTDVEFEMILDALVEKGNICNQQEADAIKSQYKYKFDTRIKAFALACYKLDDHLCLTVLYKTDANNETVITWDTIDYKNGVLCYVNNLDMPDFSEAGSVLFKWVGDGYQKA